MKQTRLLVLLGLLIVGSVVAAVTPPTDLSLRGIVEWVGVGGHIASGTSFPAVGAKGSRFTDLSNPNRAVDYRSNGTYWKPTATWNHALLDNLVYSSSGHGPVPMSYGGTGGTSSETARESLDVFSKASTTALIDDLSGVTEVASARENIDVYSTEETNQLIAQTVALLRYYVSEIPSDLPSYGSLAHTASTTESSATTPALTTTMTQVTQRITPVGEPNISQTVAGVYPFSVNLQRTGTKTAYFQTAMFKRDVAGNETHIASSSVYTVSDELRKTVVLDLVAPENVLWAATDRLVLRSYASKETTGVTVTLTFFYGNGNQSYITLSAGGGGVYARQDLSNVDPAKGRIALGFPDPTGAAGLVLTVGTDSSTLYWSSAGSDVHSALTGLDFASSGHTGFASAGDVLALWASVTAELDPMNYQENYDIMASTSALVIPLSGRTYVGIQNIDELKSIHINPGGTVASDGPANLILYAGEVWYQRLTDAAPVAFYASEATPIVIFQGK